MPRKRREESPTGIYHWIVRGMGKKALFHQAKDYEFFKEMGKLYAVEGGLSIYHYCLMTNHVHLLLHGPEKSKISRFSHFVQRRYAYYYCKEHKHNGSVFRRGYKSLVIDREEYLLECGRYIERNPVRAGMVERPEDYEYSSYRYYAKCERDDLLTPSPAYLGLAEDADLRRELYVRHVNESRIYEEMKERGLLCS